MPLARVDIDPGGSKDLNLKDPELAGADWPTAAVSRKAATRAIAFRNQADKSFEWLERAYAQRDSSMMYIKVEPLLNSLHNDPRFAALLKKLNLPN